MISPSFLLGLLCPKGNTPLSRMGNHPLFNPEMIMKKIAKYSLSVNDTCNHIFASGKNKGHACSSNINIGIFVRNNMYAFGFCNRHKHYHSFDVKVIEFLLLKSYEKRKIKEKEDEKLRERNAILDQIAHRKRQSESVHLPCNSFTYDVLFLVVGTDHHGYCSGAEIEDVNEDQMRVMKKDYDVKSLKDFNFFERGCSTGGSGYCGTEGRNFYAQKILKKTCDLHGDFCPHGKFVTDE